MTLSEPKTQIIEEGMRRFRVFTTDGDPEIILELHAFTWRYAEREARRLFPEFQGRALATEALDEKEIY